MAPLVKQLCQNNRFNLIVAVTGQHREMLDQVLKFFGIVPDFDLDLMKFNQDLFEVTAEILLGIKKVIEKVRPDLVMVHGDTATTFAAALGAFYQKVPVAHVEAGLRTNNLASPWPEEANRQLTSRLADLHFTPTEINKAALVGEGIASSKILVTGNTVIDALNLTIDKLVTSKIVRTNVNNELKNAGVSKDILNSQYILITGHRRENFGQGFLDICLAIKKLAIEFPKINFIYPVHLNPKVREPVISNLGNLANIYLIEPLSYASFVWLMKCCYLVLTDSGGVQEEAPSLGKPVLVMRKTTERQEAVKAGTVILVGTQTETIFKSVSNLILDEEIYEKMAFSHNPYGDGLASERIEKYLQDYKF